jgi:hypothetical protein
VQQALDVVDRPVSWTLRPTSSHATPFSLRKSFCGSVRTRAVMPLVVIVALGRGFIWEKPPMRPKPRRTVISLSDFEPLRSMPLVFQLLRREPGQQRRRPP